jgi:hypothetical protein
MKESDAVKKTKRELINIGGKPCGFKSRQSQSSLRNVCHVLKKYRDQDECLPMSIL